MVGVEGPDADRGGDVEGPGSVGGRAEGHTLLEAELRVPTPLWAEFYADIHSTSFLFSTLNIFTSDSKSEYIQCMTFPKQDWRIPMD